jgi:adenylate cyclase
MSRRSVFFLAFVAANTLAIAALHVGGFLPFWRVEVAIEDFIARVGRKASIDPSLVFLAIDSSSANLDVENDLRGLHFSSQADDPSRRALELMAEHWPWPRDVHGLVLDRLTSAGARAVIFDLTFPKETAGDAWFRDALARHEAKVVVACHIEELPVPSFTGPTPSLIPESEPHDSRLGFDNLWSDFDDVIRRARFRWRFEYGVYKAAEDLSLAARALQKIGKEALLPPDRGLHRFRFAGPAGAFPARSIYSIFVPGYWAENYENGEFFRNKVVVIGAAGSWQHDEHPTPFRQMSGAELQLNVINAALQRAFLTELPMALQVALIVASGLVAWLANRWVARPYLRLALLIAATIACLGAALLCYEYADLVIPCFAPLLALNLSGVSGLTLDILHERQEKTRLRRTLERYVSHNVVEEWLAHPDRYERVLGGEVRPVTVLFSDIRGFSEVAAHLDSHALVADLNEYFSAMVECVFRHGGTLDKFIGDAVMAVWGNAHSNGPIADARNAVACAAAMRDALALLNVRRTLEGKPELRIGIGMNHGDVIVGNIGSPSRMEFTVIGEPVNVAWRLQELTKRIGADVLLGVRLREILDGYVVTDAVETAELPGHGSFSFVRLVADDGRTKPASQA